jgi:hypothetical protein
MSQPSRVLERIEMPVERARRTMVARVPGRESAQQSV